jgi:hypothetical protein
MKIINWKISLIFVALALLASACNARVTRNSDGSRTVETTISQQEIQSAINASIADPLIKELTVTLQSGYLDVTGQRKHLNDASRADTLSFRLDLGVSNGALTATISNATLDGKPIEQNRVGHWNQTLANRIAIAGRKRSNSSLQAVNITNESVKMTWTISQP